MLYPNGRSELISICVIGVVLVGWIASFNYKGGIGIPVVFRDIHVYNVDNQLRVGTGDVCLANLRRIDLHDLYDPARVEGAPA